MLRPNCVTPNHKGHIVSVRDSIYLYKELMDSQQIPILFTPQTRHQEQLFEYGSRLLDLRDRSEIDFVRRQVESGKWLLWDDSLYANNFLIVQAPIQELAIKPPVGVATNMLNGPSQGEPVGAVSIPSPKILGRKFRHLLEDL